MGWGPSPETLRGSEIFVLHGEGCKRAKPAAVQGCTGTPEKPFTLIDYGKAHLSIRKTKPETA